MTIRSLGLTFVAWLAAASRGVAQDSGRFTVAIRFDVMDTTALFERSLGRDLLLQVRQEPHARLANFGWTVAVLRRPVREDSRNLLYHSRNWHGPYPTDIFAWIQQSQHYPDERVLPVYGHPLEILIRLIDCRTTGRGDEAAFVAGTVEIAWRPAPVRRPQGR